ncbi:MAG: NAD+ synthase [Candidatus Sumerlaeia bacterium]|nr:NAD+ synthase [Candidatus Sumerlaeia bacterium]
MRLYLAQMNTIVGDLEGNSGKIVEAWRRAREAGADLVLLPEQCIPGYPAKDLLLQEGFIRRCHEATDRLAIECKDGPALLVGFPERHAGSGKRLFNSAALLRGGRVEAIYRKGLLPTYDVFDELRYFDSANQPLVFECAGVRVGITICEDCWNDELYWSHRLYDRDPVEESVKAGAQLVVNLSASPFTLGKLAVRRAMLAETARRHGIAFAMNNLVGGNDDLVFDGSSMVFAPDGSKVCELPALDSGDAVIDIEGDKDLGARCVECSPCEDLPRLEALRRALVLGTRDYLEKCGFRKALIGLSGGIDSALVAAIAVEALGAENVQGVSMPSRYSSDHSVSDAEQLANNLGMGYTSVPIEGLFSQVQTDLSELVPTKGSGLAYENAQARLRGVILMTISNASGALVLTTGNKSELSVGYCTLYGDMCGGLAVIADVPKMDVYALSRHINETAGRELIPENTLVKPPSAELAPDQKDSDSLPPYEELDPIIQGYVEEGLDEDGLAGRGHDRETVRRILRLIAVNEYKRRQAAPALKVTSRAFGFGWRMPLARKLP